MLDDSYYMQIALQEAQSAFERDEVPVGCVVVCNKTIIARTHNLTETLRDVSAHAEMLAITAASEYLGGKYLHECTLYVTLEPCLMCAGALAWSQVSEIVYAASDSKRGFSRLGVDVLHPKTFVRSGILNNESADLLKRFFCSKR